MDSPNPPTPSPFRSDNTAIIAVVVFVFFVLLTLAFYYFAYRGYVSGQDTCNVLYPGSSLRAMRDREQCKDRKRGNWALPAAAMIVGSNWS